MLICACFERDFHDFSATPPFEGTPRSTFVADHYAGMKIRLAGAMDAIQRDHSVCSVAVFDKNAAVHAFGNRHESSRLIRFD